MKNSIIKRISFIILILFVSFASSAQTIGDIQNKMLELANQGDRLELSRLFAQYKDEIEPYARYYCGLVICTNNGNNEEALIYIDSLLIRTPYIFEKDNKASVAYTKAFILQQEQRFEELADFSEAYISGEQMMPGDYCERELQAYRTEGISRRHAATIQEKLMWFANYGNPFELKTVYEANKDSVDTYIRLNCERGMAQAFNDNKRAIACIDSLLNFYSQRMDTLTILNNIRRKVGILFQEGAYDVLTEYIGHLPEEYKSMSELSETCWWATILKGVSPSEISRPSEDCIVSDLLFTGNTPLLPGKINSTDCRILLNTGIPYTIINNSLAQASQITILPDSVKANYHFSEGYSGVMAVIDSLRLGNILFKNRIVYVDTSSLTALSDYTISLGASEIRSIGQVDFYPDKVVFPYRSVTEKEDPNFFLEDNYVKVLCSVGDKSYPFMFNTGYSTNLLAASVLRYSGQSTYDTKISIDTKLVPFTTFHLNHIENTLGYSFVESFPKFSINYNTMRVDFDASSIQIPHLHWMMRGDFFELEKQLATSGTLSKDHLYFYKAFIGNGKNKPAEFLCVLDSALTNISEFDKGNMLLTLRTMQEHAYYDSGQYEETYRCLSEIKSICPEDLLTSLEKASNRCELLRTTAPQQIVWGSSQASVKSSIVDDKFYYPLKVNGKEASVHIALDTYECVISMKDAQLLGLNIFDDFVYFDNIVSKLGMAETIQIGEVVAKNVVFYVLLDDNAPTVIGQSLLRLIPSIELSRDRMVLRKESQKKDGRATPMRLEKPDLYVQLNSSKGSLVAKLGGGDENIIPHYFSTAENIQIGGMPIDVNACHLDKDLDMVIDMKGVISLPYLLRQADRVVFDFENMTVSCY